MSPDVRIGLAMRQDLRGIVAQWEREAARLVAEAGDYADGSASRARHEGIAAGLRLAISDMARIAEEER